MNHRHGEYGTHLYRIWAGMKNRCSSSTAPNYKNYGGRGIIVCRQWQDYIAFAKWARSNGYRRNLSLDRRNSDDNYYPGNCRWIPFVDNANASRKGQGVRNCHNKLREEDVLKIRKDKNTHRNVLAKRYGVTVGTIHHIKRGHTWKHV